MLSCSYYGGEEAYTATQLVSGEGGTMATRDCSYDNLAQPYEIVSTTGNVSTVTPSSLVRGVSFSSSPTRVLLIYWHLSLLLLRIQRYLIKVAQAYCNSTS